MIARSHGKSRFSFVRNCQIVFQSGCSILQSHQQWMRVSIASKYPCQHLMLSVFWILALLIDVQWHLIVVLICISLMTCDGTSFHMLIFYLFIFSGEVCVKVFGPCSSSCLLSNCWVLRVVCIFWITILYQMFLLQIFFSQSAASLLILLTWAFTEQKFWF